MPSVAVVKWTPPASLSATCCLAPLVLKCRLRLVGEAQLIKAINLISQKQFITISNAGRGKRLLTGHGKHMPAKQGKCVADNAVYT